MLGRFAPCARELRAGSTESELRLWRRLVNRKLGVPFCRQYVIGPRIVDVVALSLRLVWRWMGRVTLAGSWWISGRTGICSGWGTRGEGGGGGGYAGCCGCCGKDSGGGELSANLRPDRSSSAFRCS